MTLKIDSFCKPTCTGPVAKRILSVDLKIGI